MFVRIDLVQTVIIILKALEEIRVTVECTHPIVSFLM